MVHKRTYQKTCDKILDTSKEKRGEKSIAKVVSYILDSVMITKCYTPD